jgi:hypothetical protein
VIIKAPRDAVEPGSCFIPKDASAQANGSRAITANAGAPLLRAGDSAIDPVDSPGPQREAPSNRDYAPLLQFQGN